MTTPASSPGIGPLAGGREVLGSNPSDLPTGGPQTAVLAVPDWRLRAMDEPGFDLACGLESVRRQVAHWIEYDKAGRDAEGLPTSPDTHIMSPPVWPSHGQLAAWVALFERVESRLREAAAVAWRDDRKTELPVFLDALSEWGVDSNEAMADGILKFLVSDTSMDEYRDAAPSGVEGA